MSLPLNEKNISICLSCDSCVTGGRCRLIYKRNYGALHKFIAEDHKFITKNQRVKLIAKQHVRVHNIHSPNKCERCGDKKRQLIKHHPDYTHPLIFEWLCKRCHRKEHPLKSARHKNLPYTARIRRLTMIVLSYGITAAIVLEHFYMGNIDAAMLARKMGITRERVRQFLIELHGTRFKFPKR